MAKQYVMGSYYRLVQTRRPPTKPRRTTMSDEWHIQVGTPEEARGDYEHDLQRQAELDGKTLWNSKSATATIVKQLEESGQIPIEPTKTYRVMLKNSVYYGFDVDANTRAEAMQLAHKRMDSGNWGREEYGEVDIFDLEETK